MIYHAEYKYDVFIIYTDIISQNAQRHQQDYAQPVVQESGASGGWADSIDKLLEDRRQAIEGSSGEGLEFIVF